MQLSWNESKVGAERWHLFEEWFIERKQNEQIFNSYFYEVYINETDTNVPSQIPNTKLQTVYITQRKESVKSINSRKLLFQACHMEVIQYFFDVV